MCYLLILINCADKDIFKTNVGNTYIFALIKRNVSFIYFNLFNYFIYLERVALCTLYNLVELQSNNLRISLVTLLILVWNVNLFCFKFVSPLQCF